MSSDCSKDTQEEQTNEIVAMTNGVQHFSNDEALQERWYYIGSRIIQLCTTEGQRIEKINCEAV